MLTETFTFLIVAGLLSGMLYLYKRVIYVKRGHYSIIAHHFREDRRTLSGGYHAIGPFEYQLTLHVPAGVGESRPTTHFPEVAKTDPLLYGYEDAGCYTADQQLVSTKWAVSYAFPSKAPTALLRKDDRSRRLVDEINIAVAECVHRVIAAVPLNHNNPRSIAEALKEQGLPKSECCSILDIKYLGYRLVAPPPQGALDADYPAPQPDDPMNRGFAPQPWARQ